MSELPSSIDALFQPNKNLVFVGGKGGVGKTTVASATALALSEHYKTLLLSTDPAHSTAASFDTKGLGEATKISSDTGQLTVWEPDANTLFEDFKSAHQDEIRLILDTSTYMDDEDIDRVITLVIPGIDEIMGLKTVTDQLNSGAYDKIVIDTAPTGHALRLLFASEILDQWIKAMAQLRWKYRTIQKTFKGKYTPDEGDDLLLTLKRTVARMREILADSEACEFVLVAHPTKMVLRETLSLYEQLTQNGIAVNTLVVNAISPDSEDPFYHGLHLREQQMVDSFRSAFPRLEIAKMERMQAEVQGLNQLKHFKKLLFQSMKSLS